MDPYGTALPAPKTPQENARRIATDLAESGRRTGGGPTRGADPDAPTRGGNRDFVKKDGEWGKTS